METDTIKLPKYDGILNIDSHNDNIKRNIKLAKQEFPDKFCSCIPSKSTHMIRNDIVITPNGMLKKVPQHQFSDVKLRNEEIKNYIDDNGLNWTVIDKQFTTVRLVMYDDQIIQGTLGSSEILMSNPGNQSQLLITKTYNYRDKEKTSYIEHFLADILPKCLFCLCH